MIPGLNCNFCNGILTHHSVNLIRISLVSLSTEFALSLYTSPITWSCLSVFVPAFVIKQSAISILPNGEEKGKTLPEKEAVSILQGVVKSYWNPLTENPPSAAAKPSETTTQETAAQPPPPPPPPPPSTEKPLSIQKKGAQPPPPPRTFDPNFPKEKLNDNTKTLLINYILDGIKSNFTENSTYFGGIDFVNIN